MKNKRTVLILAIGFIVLLAAAFVLYNTLSDGEEPVSVQQTEQEASAEGQESVAAPDFSVTDQDGNTVRLSDFAGKPVILNFWASWCGPCKNEMPVFEKAYAEYGDEIQFMMVNLTDGVSERQDTAEDFIKSSGYTFPVYYDLETEGANAYGVQSIPVTFFIDAEGNAVAGAKGSLTHKSLQTGIDMLLE